MPNQKALLVKEQQGSFILSSWPIPHPGHGELLVKIQAAALNPADWKMKKTGHFIETYPAVLGLDLSGEVEELGEGVEGFAKGNRVIAPAFIARGYAAFQQYTLIPADLTAKIPPSLDYAEAASIPIGYSTAAIGLLAAHPSGAGLNPTLDPNVNFSGQPAFVFGGSSSVGQFVLQILRILKYCPIITYASAKHTDFLKSLGATDVIDRCSVPIEDLPKSVQNLTCGAPLRIVYDAISEPDTQEACFALTAVGGVTIAIQPGLRDRNISGKKLIHIFGSPYINREFGVRLWRSLATQLEEGIIVPNRVERLPNGLAGIADGLGRLENNMVSGIKLVALPQETS